ncbi:hypothetical protein KUW09_04960 [Mameliella alba]|nr:hypothetical protein [Antarctobacter heliothermus]MBY6143379.1 hypothetical protein [Mameliella alba]MCA0952896.1 hypothetical protein [Mameliella alba]
MRGFAIALTASLALGGCMEGAAPVTGGGGGQGAQARKLSTGMSPAQAEAVFGVDAGYERNPADWDETCVSYVYGTEGNLRYVHAIFRGDRLVRATDGHGAICTYGGLVDPSV